MHKRIKQLNRVSRKYFRRRSDIPFFKHEILQILSKQHPDSYIKFPFIYQQWSFYILLNYEILIFHKIPLSFLFFLFCFGFLNILILILQIFIPKPVEILKQQTLQLSKRVKHMDAVPSVQICWF